ncbi:hypothetical protein FH972_017492 [Carpinus fangiana]|uniref:Uncharacterized protein n=1 Tax=Carpinus fangiana TaxID=176857 RepID=A0A5N6RJ34_9ROSI|nr:hypothetical protein FH972_017492 [Carpinus fangiana]
MARNPFFFFAIFVALFPLAFSRSLSETATYTLLDISAALQQAQAVLSFDPETVKPLDQQQIDVLLEVDFSPWNYFHYLELEPQRQPYILYDKEEGEQKLSRSSCKRSRSPLKKLLKTQRRRTPCMLQSILKKIMTVAIILSWKVEDVSPFNFSCREHNLNKSMWKSRL